MSRDNQNIKFKGAEIRVSGNVIKEGDNIPFFRLTGLDLSDLTLDSLKNKNIAILSVPSVDTPVCSIETKKFNSEASSLNNTVILGVSMDLPFAQKRWCAAESVNNVVLASDYKYRNFGTDFGVYIDSLGLLTRAVFVADREGIVRYVEYVEEVTNEPDYKGALAALKHLS